MCHLMSVLCGIGVKYTDIKTLRDLTDATRDSWSPASRMKVRTMECNVSGTRPISKEVGLSSE